MLRSPLLRSLLLVLVAVPLFAAERTGKLEGKITGRDVAANELSVDHRDVPGLMGAMEMAYPVRDAKVDALPPNGASITAVLHVNDDGDFWLTDVQPAAPNAMHHDASDPTTALLMRQASGTSMNPIAAPMEMAMFHRAGWMLMAHGAAFVSQVVQSGPRGDDKLFSTNWVMGMADRPLSGGHLMLRTMLSLEPATVGDQYPELFQTGETLHGRPLVDAQHPHDFVMELAAEYAHPITDDAVLYVYAAPHGDPSLGPVAYPHRASASELPQATLGHHLQDSTHIAASVLTIGGQQGPFGLALSGFRGREPDEKRWDIESGKIDSWAVRATFDASPNLSVQLSTGRLKHPEAAEPGNIQRTTASFSYSGAMPAGRADFSMIFGRNDKTRGRSTNSWLAEGVLRFGGGNYATGRAEIVDRDELEVGPAVSTVKALTLGYSRDLLSTQWLSGALGANATLYAVPRALRSAYGSSPHSFYLFIRLRSAGGGGMRM